MRLPPVPRLDSQKRPRRHPNHRAPIRHHPTLNQGDNAISSKYQPATTKRNTPPWCKKGLYPVIPPIIGGVPQYVVAYLQWRDLPAGVEYDVTTTLKLQYEPITQKWSGRDWGPGLTLGGLLEKSGAPNTYDLTINLYKDDVLSEDHTWTNIPIGPNFPWDSLLQELVTDPTNDRQSMQIFA